MYTLSVRSSDRLETDTRGICPTQYSIALPPLPSGKYRVTMTGNVNVSSTEGPKIVMLQWSRIAHQSSTRGDSWIAVGTQGYTQALHCSFYIENPTQLMRIKHTTASTGSDVTTDEHCYHFVLESMEKIDKC